MKSGQSVRWREGRGGHYQAAIAEAAGDNSDTRPNLARRAAFQSYSTFCVTTELSRQIPAALVAAGLPASSVADFMTSMAAGGATLSTIEGVTPEIMAQGAQAYRWAYSDAYKTIFLVSLAFGGLAIIASFFIPNIDSLMGGKVAATLKGREKEAEQVKGGIV